MSRMITRSFSTAALKVVDNVAKQQFVVSMKGAEAVLDYEKKGNHILLKYTEVPIEFRGKGVGKLLAKYAFDAAKEQNLSVTCQCHFLASYYQSNLDKYRNLKVKLEL